MVEVNVTVCCPICEEKVELISTYGNSLAEFERHMDKHTNHSFNNCSSSNNDLPTSHSDKLKCNRGKYPFGIKTSHYRF